MPRLLLGLVLIVQALSASAGEIYLEQYSSHQGSCSIKDCPDGEYNSSHDFIGYRFDNDIMISTFNNSYHDRSYMLSKFWNFYLPERYAISDYVTPNIQLGVVHGYEDKLPSIGGVAFGGFFGLDIHNKNRDFGININYIPGTVITMGFNFKVDF